LCLVALVDAVSAPMLGGYRTASPNWLAEAPHGDVVGRAGGSHAALPVFSPHSR
jgi:hypothetical protein